MTNKDILNYITFRTELEQLLNKYVGSGLPAIIIRPVLEEALNAIIKASSEEIENAKAEVAVQDLVDEHKDKEEAEEQNG